MPISNAEYAAILSRLRVNRKESQPLPSGSPVERESDLHDKIIAYCNSQWPRWKYRHARMDKPTTEEKGVEDFTVFVPLGKTLHIECKAKGKKQSPEQLEWAKELAMIGHELHVVNNFDDFIEIISTKK